MHLSPMHKIMLVSEFPKEEEESFCAEECGTSAIEQQALEFDSGPLHHQGREIVKDYVHDQQLYIETSDNLGCSGASIDGFTRTNQDFVYMCCEAESVSKAVAAGLSAMETDMKDDCCPDSSKISEVESGVSRICLNKRSFKTERILSDLKLVDSFEHVQFSADDCLNVSLPESQMAPQKQSAIGDSSIMEEGMVSLPCKDDNLSVQGSMKSVEDLSDAVNGLLVDIPSSTINDVSDSPNKGHQRMSSAHVDVSIPGFNFESSSLQLDASSGQHFPSYVHSSSTMPSEDAGNFPSSVEKAESPLSYVPDMVLDSGSNCDLFRQEASKIDGVLRSNDSVAVADASCFADEGQGSIDSHQRSVSNETSLRRSSRANKSIQKAPNRNCNRRQSKKTSDRTINLLPTAARSRRSRLNRSARVSNWGLFEALSNHIELNTLVDQESGSVKSGKKSRKKDKVQVSTSHGLSARSHVSSGHIRLKLKLVNKSKSTVEPNPLTGVDVQVVHFTGNGENKPDLSNGIKDFTQEASQKSLGCSSDMKLGRSAASPENPRVAVHPVHKVLGPTLTSDKCSREGIGGRISSDKEGEKSVVSTDDRHLNSGTSPDSEVIQVPDSQFPSEVLEVHRDGETGNASPIISKTRRKKERKRETPCQLVDSDVQNSLLSSSIVDKTEMSEIYCSSVPKSDMATKFDVGDEPADSRNSKKLPPPAKSKGNRKSKSKLNSCSTPRLDMDKSRGVKGDKWKLLGKHGMDDRGNKTSTAITPGGVTSEDVSGLPVIPGPRSAWVCCDDCLKWRCIPSNLADIIDETNGRWICKDNQDKAFADCSVPQEKSDAEINAELNLSDGEEGRNVQISGPQQSSWMLIKSNIFLHRSRKAQTLDEIMVCHCKSTRNGKLGCGDECLNRMLNIECVQGTCPCGDLCANQQFQRQSYASLKWFRSGKKGYGLQVMEDITQGQFLIEYVGEVLELPAYEARLREYASEGHKHFYFMTLNGNEVIDACAKGNLGRFINHSCNPNCRTEKWMVNGEICIGIFAVRNIKKGEELTFDYNYVRVFGAAAKKCYCGSAQCRGYIGGDRLNDEVIVQGDSDEEFPEPVAVYENGEIADEYNMTSNFNSLDVLEDKNEDALLQNDVEITSDDNDVINELASSEKDGLNDSVVGYSQVNSSLEIVGYMQAKNTNKTTTDVQQEIPRSIISICSVSPKRSDSLSVNLLNPESMSEPVDTRFNRRLMEIAGGEAVHSKSRPRMKISRPCKYVKRKEHSDSSATVDKSLVTSNKSQSVPNKLKKVVESSPKHRLETVEEKLNELLDNVGGLCKRKDAFKGYLKLLVLTAASGDSSHHETIQSNKDLSMILDAILKTRSRTVLTDILNKNGLQMLHSLMKKCRGNFNKIPILRKLLKIFEVLADRKILTLEHINAEPPRPGMESFRDSILTLTEYEDRKVHQIARNFRDRWIPRPFKKFNCMGTHYQRSDQVKRSSVESADRVKESLPSNHPIDSDGLETSSRFGVRGILRKRKSGWDQPPDAVPYSIKEQKTEPGSSVKFNSDHNHLKTYSQEIHPSNEDNDERQSNEEDAPPGFSCPAFGNRHLSNATSSTVFSFSQQYPGPLNCPSQITLGHPQERYNSGLPMSYGIPFNTVQEFGTPQSSTGDRWVIAPGMPFRPFPPLPPSAFSGVRCAGKSQERSSANTHTDDHGVPMIPNGDTHLQHEGGTMKQRQKNVNYGVEVAGNSF